MSRGLQALRQPPHLVMTKTGGQEMEWVPAGHPAGVVAVITTSSPVHTRMSSSVSDSNEWVGMRAVEPDG